MRHNIVAFLLANTLAATSLPAIANLSAATISSASSASEFGITISDDDIAHLDSLLAPIALYPDPLLYQILEASFYTNDLKHAFQWQQRTRYISEYEKTREINKKHWPASVKALLPFEDVIRNMVADEDWLYHLNYYHRYHQDDLLARVQLLRHRAYEQGHLRDSQHMQVRYEHDIIVLTPRFERTYYVPHYHSNYVYGTWWHRHHRPHIWLSLSVNTHHDALRHAIIWGSAIYLHHTALHKRNSWRRSVVWHHHRHNFKTRYRVTSRHNAPRRTHNHEHGVTIHRPKREVHSHAHQPLRSLSKPLKKVHKVSPHYHSTHNKVARGNQTKSHKHKEKTRRSAKQKDRIGKYHDR
ncbi:DUF3300 domain-containing protein [Aestuariibacter sp. AA17]|uniref:DUF3300 domain-containing protein n=1 Tax=Fluctibacter corallii TaxID=2984329 RepID=A0ABT3AC05_9ALTE|nr:DUF3300 domain-containing protein [Aestuariibacter sp. AA17]MCV2886212.1 DUF3300 domain-containing protein [Aestuariibacter sp. AA17]